MWINILGILLLFLFTGLILATIGTLTDFMKLFWVGLSLALVSALIIAVVTMGLLFAVLTFGVSLLMS